MERKIGEIFEYNGEWYQCVEQPKYDKPVCTLCAFQGNGNCDFDRCSSSYRSDKKNVIFKKLEKVGEPYTDYCPSGRVIYFQRYKCYRKPAISKETIIHWADDISVSIEIKQTKEDMEENKLNLKPFDIQKAREGKPVCTRDGRKARIICFDRRGDKFPIVALLDGCNEEHSEVAETFTNEGLYEIGEKSSNDLMMLPEKKEGWVNLYRKDNHIITSKDVFCSEGGAIECVDGEGDGEYYISTVKIQWEE